MQTFEAVVPDRDHAIDHDGNDHAVDDYVISSFTSLIIVGVVGDVAHDVYLSSIQL